MEGKAGSRQSHFFYNGRDNGMKVRDYSNLPESLGAVDFQQGLTIEKFVKPVPTKKKDRKDDLHVVQRVEDAKKLKEEADRLKKIKNVDKLKETLA